MRLGRHSRSERGFARLVAAYGCDIRSTSPFQTPLIAVPNKENSDACQGRDKTGRTEEPQRSSFGSLGPNYCRLREQVFGRELRGGRAGRLSRLIRRRYLRRLQAEGLTTMGTEVALPGLPVANREGFPAARAGEREVSHCGREPSRGKEAENHLSVSQ